MMSSLFTSQTELIALSDIHIQSEDDLNGQRLLALLRQLRDTPVECLVLVGDIFEFILGSQRYFRHKFNRIGLALADLAASGTRVVYLEGNHEFDLPHLGWPGVTMIQEQDFWYQSRSGHQIKFTHGDLVFSPVAYRRFRKVVKSRWFLYLARWLPGPVMDALALRGAQASRAQDAYRDLDIAQIHSEMSKWLDDHARYGIFGHFHVPFADQIAGREQWLVSSDCWQNPSLIKLQGQTLTRLTYEGSSLLPSIEHALEPVLGRKQPSLMGSGDVPN